MTTGVHQRLLIFFFSPPFEVDLFNDQDSDDIPLVFGDPSQKSLGAHQPGNKGPKLLERLLSPPFPSFSIFSLFCCWLSPEFSYRSFQPPLLLFRLFFFVFVVRFFSRESRSGEF